MTTTESGRPVEWMIESDSTSILTRSGWNAKSVAVGSAVTVRANPDKNTQRHHALLVTMALPNGTELRPRVNGPDAVAPAKTLAGVWNSLRGFTQRRIGALKPTPKGLAAATSYTEAENPVARCVPYATPFLTGLPYLNQVEMQKDRILIHSEFLNVDRTIFMDGRGHPDNWLPTNYGHSIGWWDGDTLVIDTVGFNEDFWFERRGLPHTEQLHMIERLTRTSKDAMEYRITIDDPGAYTKPYSGGFDLRFRGDNELFEYMCQQANYAHELMVGRDASDKKISRTSEIVP